MLYSSSRRLDDPAWGISYASDISNPIADFYPMASHERVQAKVLSVQPNLELEEGKTGLF